MAMVVGKFAFGMKWCTSTSEGREEMTKEAKRLKANVYTEVRSELSRMYGFAEIKKWKGVRSAAAAVADALTDGGLFLHRLDAKGTTCLIAIDKERRLPVPGMDQIGPRSQMVELAKQFVQRNPAFSAFVYGDVEASEIEGAHGLGFDRISNDAVIAAELKPVSKSNLLVMYVAMCALGASGALFSEQIEELITPTPTVAVASLETQYRDQVKSAVAQVVQANQFPSNVMAGFLPFLTTIASDADGWKIESLICTGTDCEAVWRRQPGATSEGFLRALNLKASDTSITFYDVDFAKRKLSFKKAETRKKLVLAPNATFSEIVGSWFQRLADRHLEKPSIGPMSPLVPNNGATLPASEMPQVGQFQFAIPFAQNDLQAVAGLPELMTIEAIELRREGQEKIKVKFTGKYYAY